MRYLQNALTIRPRYTECKSSGRWPGGGETRPLGIRLYIIKKYMTLSIMVGPLRFYFVVLCINYMIKWKFLNSGHYKFKSHLHLSRAYGTWNSPFWALGISTLVTDWLIAKNWICRAIVIFFIFLGATLFSESLS